MTYEPYPLARHDVTRYRVYYRVPSLLMVILYTKIVCMSIWYYAQSFGVYFGYIVHLTLVYIYGIISTMEEVTNKKIVPTIKKRG